MPLQASKTPSLGRYNDDVPFTKESKRNVQGAPVPKPVFTIPSPSFPFQINVFVAMLLELAVLDFVLLLDVVDFVLLLDFAVVDFTLLLDFAVVDFALLEVAVLDFTLLLDFVVVDFALLDFAYPDRRQIFTLLGIMCSAAALSLRPRKGGGAVVISLLGIALLVCVLLAFFWTVFFLPNILKVLCDIYGPNDDLFWEILLVFALPGGVLSVVGIACGVAAVRRRRWLGIAGIMISLGYLVAVCRWFVRS